MWDFLSAFECMDKLSIILFYWEKIGVIEF